MLIRRETLDRVREGSVTLAFRRWRRPTVRAGGTLMTAVGRSRIVSVRTVRRITEAEARRAGFTSRAALLEDLGDREGELHRIELRWQGDDPGLELRESPVDEPLLKRLPVWGREVLEPIGKHPRPRAGDLPGTRSASNGRFEGSRTSASRSARAPATGLPRRKP